MAAPLCADAQGSQTMNKPADQQQMMNQITPSAEPAVTRRADPYLTADFIWWRAQEDGLEYAMNGVGNGNTNADKGSLHKPHFEYEPGFKVGMGLKFRHDGWDLYAQYTWLHSDGDETKVHTDSDGDSNVVSNIFIPSSSQNPVTGTTSYILQTTDMREAEGKWSLHFNVLDLELGRNFWISKWLTLRPYVGMKFSWIDQDFDVEYEGIPTGSTGTANVKLDMDLDQTAIGLRTGLDTAWYMWKKWCIFGELAISGMWNDFDSSRKDTLYKNGGHLTLNRINRDSHSVTAVLEWALGLRFETAFHNDDFDFMLQAGWEEQVWFNQNQFVMMPNQTPADLNFEGLTVKAAFYF